MKAIEPGAIGVWMEDAPGNFDGRLWRVAEVYEPEPGHRCDGIAFRIVALDCLDDVEDKPPSWWIEPGRFWCLLDAGVVNI